MGTLLIALSLFLYCAGSSGAQQPAAPALKDYQWNTFTAADSGLPDDHVNALAIGADGALWVGTADGGLARFEDGEWQVFTTANSPLPSDSVSALEVGADGGLWVGIGDLSGIGLAHFKDGEWQVFTAANSPLRGNTVWDLAAGADGALWVGTDSGGLARFEDGEWQVFTVVYNSLPSNVVLMDLEVGADGALWLGTHGGGLVRFKGGEWQVFTTANSPLPSDSVSDLALGADGALWLGTDGGGLARLEGGEWQVFTTANSPLPSDSVSALAVGADGALWVNTRSDLALGADGALWVNTRSDLALGADGHIWVKSGGGLARLEGGEWQVLTAANSPLRDSVSALAVGADGALWAGTGGGLARFNFGEWQVFTTANSPLPSDSVSALAVGADGALWAGTGDVYIGRGGLVGFEDGEWQVFTIANSPLPGVSVSALAVGADGILWVGTGGGLARFEDGEWQVFTAANSPLPSDRVSALAVGANGILWVGTDGGGLARFEDGEWQVFTTANSPLPGVSVSALAVGADGALWAGTGDLYIGRGGLARFEDGEWQVFTTANSPLPANDVSALAAGADGALWVSIGPYSGLARFDDGEWQVFTTANSPLPSDSVSALAVSADGTLWVGTDGGGLVRFEDGEWQVFTTANSPLPSDRVSALAVGADGAIWVGTFGAAGGFISGGGLARFDSRPVSPKLQGVPAPPTILQRENTFAVRAFDPTFRSDPQHFRYEWSVEKRGWLGAEPVATTTTRSPFYIAVFPENGPYVVRVRAIDRYGYRSAPAEFGVTVEVPKPEPWLERLKWIGSAMGGVSLLYLIALVPLLLFYPRAGWARSAVNSGAFSRFPILHKSLLSSRWARRRLFRRYADHATQGEEIAHYISQAVCPAGGGEPLPLARAEDPIGDLRARGRYLLVLGRSGTGKSVLLRRLHRLEAARFRSGVGSSLPVLINAPAHLRQADLAAALKSALRRDGKVELPDEVLDFLIRKGGFLIFVDGLNEVPEVAEALRPFLNDDSHNAVLMASQTDVLRRQDVAVFTMVEVSEEQAAAYLNAAVGPGAWDALPPGLRALARNPQDLALIAEVAGRLGPENLPSRRAALYAAKVEDDSALREWVETADPRLGAVYALAFRMLSERRVLDEPTLAEWVREALDARELGPDEVGKVTAAVRRSRLFREAIAHDRLGRPQPVLAFDHELISSFLAARHVRAALTGPERGAMLDLAERETWQNLFYFVVDELSAATLPGALLDDLLVRGGEVPLRIVAYAIESKKGEAPPLPGRIEHAYATAKLREDVRMTPAA